MSTHLDLRTTPTNYSRIGYDNLLRQGTLLASGGTGRYAADWRGDRYWEPGSGSATLQVTLSSASECNYLAIYGHNLASIGATVTVVDTGGDMFTPTVPADDGPVWISFDGSTETAYTVTIAGGSGDIAIAVMSIGRALQFDREGLQAGWSPEDMDQVPDVVNTVSENGVLIGRTIQTRPGLKSLVVSNVDIQFAVTEWKPFRAHALRYPWFIAYAVEDTYDAGVDFAWTEKAPPPDRFSRRGNVNFRWQVRTGPSLIGEAEAGTTPQEDCLCSTLATGGFTVGDAARERDPTFVTLPSVYTPDVMPS